MKKFLLIALFLTPFVSFAAPVTWDGNFGNQVLQPLKSFWGATIKGNNFTATSTSATSTFPQITGNVISGFGLTSCSDATDKITWIGGLFGCGIDETGNDLATTSPWTANDLVQVTNNGTVNSIATSSLGLPTFADLPTTVWEQFNGMGIRPKTATDKVLIGGSATTTEDTLEVQGSQAITDNGSSIIMDILDYFDLGMFFLPRITPNSDLGNVLFFDGIFVVREPVSNGLGLCSGANNPCFIWTDNSISTPVYAELDLNDTSLDFGNALQYNFSAPIFPTNILDSDGDPATSDQILVGDYASTGQNNWVNSSVLSSKWITGTFGTRTGIHPNDSLGVDALYIGSRGFVANGTALNVAGGSINSEVATSSYLIGGNRALDFCDGSITSLCISNAGNNTMTGINNIAIGKDALVENTTGSDNVLVGVGVLSLSTTGSDNVIAGHEAGLYNTLNRSVGVGKYALYGAGTGNNSSSTGAVAIGYESMYNATSSPFTTCGGYQSCKGAFPFGDVGSGLSTGNTAWGAYALTGLQTEASYNTALGYESGKITVGDYNLFAGYRAGYNSFSGDNNIFFGQNAGFGGTANQASDNIGIGYNSLLSITSGSGNVGIGSEALQSLTSGFDNFALGANALDSVTDGDGNVAIGVSALFQNITGNKNVGIGDGASYYNNSATNTVAIGADTARGTANYSNQNGVYIGYEAGRSASTGSDNNTFVGYQAGIANTIGANNIFLGYQAGSNVTTASNNIGIGYNIDMPTGSNLLNIGNLLFGTGIDGTGTTLSSGNIGIGITTPARKLHISDVLRMEPRSSAPTSPALGDIYVDSDSSELCFYDGSSWTGLKAGGVCS